MSRFFSQNHGGYSVFQLAGTLLETYWRIDRKSRLSMILGAVSAAGQVREFVEGKKSLAKLLEKEGFSSEYETIAPFVFEVLKKKLVSEKRDFVDDETIQIFFLDDVEICFPPMKDDVDGMFLKNKKKFNEVFREYFWDTFGNDVVVSVRKQGWNNLLDVNGVEGERHPVIGRYSPENILKRLNVFLDNGIGRTMIVSGPPGTGKTTLARHVAGKHGNTLVITPEAIHDISAPAFVQLIDLLKPNVVLLDDFDRVSSYQVSRFLEEVSTLNEKARKHGLLLIATVNDLGALDTAMKRPGRFDDLIEVNYPDVDDRKKIIKFYADESGFKLTRKRLKEIAEMTEGLTGAYLRLLCERLSVYGTRDAKKETEAVVRQAEICNNRGASEEDEDDCVGGGNCEECQKCDDMDVPVAETTRW